MYFEYWIVLFSAWAMANLTGLLISDSFKTVVTIYILIPFLVIPQIILSGIIVKYENLNPKISSPKRIPFYGEIITARWAYEGLATYQFMNNEYDRKFYYWEKVRSNVDFKSNYHLKDLRNKLNFIKRNLDNQEEAETIESHLRVMRNEFRDEFQERLIMKGYFDPTPTFSYKHLDNLYPDTFTGELIAYTEEYLTTLEEFYKKAYKVAFTERAKIIEQSDLEAMRDLERAHTNKKLKEFVTNKNVIDRIVEYKGDLIRKYEPIYMDPTNRFVKAHFYAPRKMIAGTFFPTIWVNIAVIWFFTILLYIALYFRILKGLLDLIERLAPKKY
jgi:hypothetical protein